MNTLSRHSFLQDIYIVLFSYIQYINIYIYFGTLQRLSFHPYPVNIKFDVHFACPTNQNTLLTHKNQNNKTRKNRRNKQNAPFFSTVTTGFHGKLVTRRLVVVRYRMELNSWPEPVESILLLSKSNLVDGHGRGFGSSIFKRPKRLFRWVGMGVYN